MATKQSATQFIGSVTLSSGEKVRNNFARVVAPTGIEADFNTDGSADEVEINAAITAVNSAGGGVVTLRKGTYTCSSSVNLLSNVTLSGEGMGATIIKCANAASIHLIYIDTVTKVTLCNLEVDGNKANNPSQTGHNIRVGHGGSPTNVCDNIVIENVYTHDAGLHGFITAYDNNVQNGSLKLVNVRSDNNGTSSNGSGFYFNGFDSIEGNNLTCSGNQLDGIQWKTSNNLNFTNVITHDNLRFGAFAVDGHANISNMSSYSNGQIGLHVQNGGTFDNTVISATNVNTYLNGQDGVRIDSCDGCTLSNFRVYNNNTSLTTNAGIRLLANTADTCNRNMIENFRVYDDQATPTQTYGIWATGAGTIDLNQTSSGDCYGNTTTQFRQDTWAVTNRIFNVGGANPQIIKAHGNLTTSKTFDRIDGHYQTFTLTGNLTATLTAAKQRGDILTFQITQDATGSRVITWPSNFKKAGGTLTLSTAASAVDVISMLWDGTNWREVSRSLNGS